MKKSIGPKTILYPSPVLIVGTYDNTGRPNVMTVAWGGICCSSPPCVAISVREATYTYSNLVDQKAFTVSIPSASYVVEADYFGIASGKNAEKFAVTGLTPVKSDVVNAPYVGEFPFVLECKVIQIVKIGLHTQFIGQIEDVKVEESMLTEKGRPDVDKVCPIMWAPDRGDYYGFGQHLGKAFSIGKTLIQD